MNTCHCVVTLFTSTMYVTVPRYEEYFGLNSTIPTVPDCPQSNALSPRKTQLKFTFTTDKGSGKSFSKMTNKRKCKENFAKLDDVVKIVK